jgi:hypothetical protein
VVDPAAIDSPAKAAPVIVHDLWTQTARGVQESIARDLKVIKRRDELLSRPIWKVAAVAEPNRRGVAMILILRQAIMAVSVAVIIVDTRR